MRGRPPPIDVDYIYAGSEYQTGKIYRITKSDGTVATLAEGKGNNAKLPFLHGNDVWFGTDNGVFKVAKTGSGGVQQVSPVAETALTFDGDEVFGCHFVPFTTTDVVRVDPADGGVAKLGQALGCESMSANGKYFFFGGSNSFGRKRVDGSDTAVVLGNYSARRVVADGDYVYSITSYDGEVRRIKIEGAGSNTAFETVAKYNGSTSDEGDLTVDATHVYWTIGSSAGKVFRAPKAGGPPELIADNFSKPVGIVVDDHAIYWSERDRDTLWTRQK